MDVQIVHMVDRNAESRFIGIILACRSSLEYGGRFTVDPRLVTCEKCQVSPLTPEQPIKGKTIAPKTRGTRAAHRLERGMQWCSGHRAERPKEEFYGPGACRCRKCDSLAKAKYKEKKKKEEQKLKPPPLAQVIVQYSKDNPTKSHAEIAAKLHCSKRHVGRCLLPKEAVKC